MDSRLRENDCVPDVQMTRVPLSSHINTHGSLVDAGGWQEVVC